MEEKPSYYSILPANVRYDNNLKANEKLLYSEITSLCNKSGVCFASNKYFSNLYNVDLATISRWINNLIDNNYLNVSYQKDNTRLLTIKSIPIDEKINTLLTKKSNIIINNNNKYNKEENSKEETIFDYYQNKISNLSPSQYEQINNYLNDMSEELIRYAIDKTIENGSKSFNYFKAILNDFSSRGYKDITDIKTTLKSTSNYSKTTKETPSWMEQDIKSEELTEEELNELEKEFEIFN